MDFSLKNEVEWNQLNFFKIPFSCSFPRNNILAHCLAFGFRLGDFWAREFQILKPHLSRHGFSSYILSQWFSNCRKFPFQTVKISFSKLSKFSFPNCQNLPFQTVKISFSKLSKFPFPNCQNFPFQTVKIFIF